VPENASIIDKAREVMEVFYERRGF
jgi:hypothetical protein